MSCFIGGENLENCLRPLDIDENTQMFQPATSGKIYVLGNGQETEDADIAREKHMAREYPQLKNDQTGTVFIPSEFLSQYPNVLDSKDTKVLEEMEKGDVERDKKDKFYNETQVRGETSERRIFKQLTDVLGNEKGLVVFRSYNYLTASTPTKKREMDYLVVSLWTQTIINIECKSNMNKRKLNDAHDQWESNYQFLKSTLSFGPGWQFVRVLAFTDIRDIRVSCDNCKKFFVGPSSTFSDVWNNILAMSSGTNITEALRQDYYNIVSRLAFTLSMNFPTNPGAQRSVASKKLQDNLDSVSHPENIILWSRGQLEVLKDKSKEKVLFTSNFGTGKTVLLKAKALETEQNCEKKRVLYVTFPYHKNVVNWKQFIIEEAKLLAKDHDNLEVMSWFDLEDNVRQKMTEEEKKEWFEDKEQVFRMFVLENREDTAGIFVDEFLPEFFLEHMLERKEINIAILQPLKAMFFSFSKDDITSMHENVADFLRTHLGVLKSMKAKYPGDPSMQAFFSGGLKIVGDSKMNYEDSERLWSFLSKFFQVWMIYIRNPHQEFSDQNKRLFDDLMDILKRHYSGQGIEDLGGWFLQYTLSAVHFLKRLSSIKDYNGLIWIAANSDFPIGTSNKLLCHEYTGFCFPLLKYNMRNVYKVADFASSIDRYERRYEMPINAILGKKPFETDVIDVRYLNDKETVAEFFGQFKIALEKLDNDTDDLLVIGDDKYPVSVIKSLYKLIQDYCIEKEIPCLNIFDDENLQEDMRSFLTNGRKGIVLGHFFTVQGFEFKSVIYITDEKYRIFSPNFILRARINLYVIKYKRLSHWALETDVRYLNDKETADEFFGQFKIALENLDNDTDDLLVIGDDQCPSSVIKSLYKLIQDYCHEKEIPCLNIFDDENLQEDMRTFLTNERKGIVLGNFITVQGSEFKSVIYFTEDEHSIFSPNFVLRAGINLCMIKYKQSSSWTLLVGIMELFQHCRTLWDYMVIRLLW